MSLLKRYLFIRPKENIDAVRNTVLPSLNSIVANLVNKSLANTSRQLQGLQLYFISLDKPLVFTYNNDELMVKGSELLKLPLLYTSRGRIDTRYAGIEPDLYYRIGNDGSFDNTHYLNFTNEDTYTPIDLDKLQYVLNQAFAKNNEFGSTNEQKRLGQITPTITNNVREVATGFSPGVDAAMITAENNPTLANIEALRGYNGVMTSANRAIAGMHPVSIPLFSSTMAESAYKRAANAEHWWDYPLAVAEGGLAAAPFFRPIKSLYLGIRGAINPKYSLSRAINNTPLNVDMLASYGELLPVLKYLFSNFVKYDRGYPFYYLEGHLHGIAPTDLGRVLATQGYFNKPKVGPFKFDAKLPRNIKTSSDIVKTQPINYPIQVSVNPELPNARWGIRGERYYPERTISWEEAPKTRDIDKLRVSGYVNQNGEVNVTSAFPSFTEDINKGLNYILIDFFSDNPSVDSAGLLNSGRKFWDTHAYVTDGVTPAKDPFKAGPKNVYVPFRLSSITYPKSMTNAQSMWNSGKAETINYLLSDTYKTRVMKNLNLTEDLANAYILLLIKNLNNVELVNLGRHRIGQPYYGYTIGYSVGEQSGPNTFSRLQNSSDWLPDSWPELKYIDFISPYENHLKAYNFAKLGKTLVGLTEGSKPYNAKAGFEEATHTTTRGGIDPALSDITGNNREWAKYLLGLDPNMVDPTEARTVGIMIDKAWDAILGKLPSYYNKLTHGALRERFFYDLLRASDDAGELFYREVPPEFKREFDPYNNAILNKAVNGLDPDEALYNFWENFVYNTPSNGTINNLNENYT